MGQLVSATCAGDGSIRTFALDGNRIVPSATLPVGKGVGALALSNDGNHAIAATKADADAPPQLVVLDLDRACGAWVRRCSLPVGDAQTYLEQSPDGDFLLGVSYSGGTVSVWPLVDGVPQQATAELHHLHPHCIRLVGRHVYVAVLGEDLISCHALTADGRLEPLDVAAVAQPEGSGPRHLAISDDGQHVYCVTEFSGEVVHHRRDPETGILTRQDTVSICAPGQGLKHSRLGADPVAEHLVWGADVHLVDDLLLASERTASTIAVIKVEDDGSLGRRRDLVDVQAQPRGFTVTGRDVLVVGERSDEIGRYRLDERDHLVLLDAAPNGDGSNWVRVH